MTLRVQVLTNRFPGMDARLRRYAADQVRAEVQAVAGYVQANIEKYGLIDTGRMLGSVRGRMQDQASGVVEVPAVSDDGFPYPVVHDQGSIHHEATGFFTEAVMRGAAEFPGRFRGLEEALA